MDYYFDLYAKYHDEDKEVVIARMLTHGELMVLVNYLLRERKRNVNAMERKTKHYVDYLRIE